MTATVRFGFIATLHAVPTTDHRVTLCGIPFEWRTWEMPPEPTEPTCVSCIQAADTPTSERNHQ